MAMYICRSQTLTANVFVSSTKTKVEIERAKPYLAPLRVWCGSVRVQGEVHYLGVKQVAYRKKEKVCS